MPARNKPQHNVRLKSVIRAMFETPCLLLAIGLAQHRAARPNPIDILA